MKAKTQLLWYLGLNHLLGMLNYTFCFVWWQRTSLAVIWPRIDPNNQDPASLHSSKIVLFCKCWRILMFFEIFTHKDTFLATNAWDYHPNSTSTSYLEAQCPFFALMVLALQTNSVFFLAPLVPGLLTTNTVGPNLGTWFFLICRTPFIGKSAILSVVAMRASNSTTARILNFSPMFRIAAAFPTWDNGIYGCFSDADCTPVLTGLQTAGEPLLYLRSQYNFYIVYAFNWSRPSMGNCLGRYISFYVGSSVYYIVCFLPI